MSLSKSNQAFNQSKFIRKHVFLTLNDKLCIIEKFENGASVNSICEEYKIGKSTASHIRKNKDEIKKKKDETNISKKKIIRKSDSKSNEKKGTIAALRPELRQVQAYKASPQWAQPKLTDIKTYLDIVIQYVDDNNDKIHIFAYNEHLKELREIINEEMKIKLRQRKISNFFKHVMTRPAVNESNSTSL